MTPSSLRRLAAGGALVFVALAGSPVAQAQVLHPLPPDFLATLQNIDTSSDEIAASVTAIKSADLTYSMFSRHRAEEAIARMEQQLPALKARTADMRREESLRMLLSMRTAFSEVQRNVGAVSDILHGVTVRTPMQADELDRLLARLDGATAHLDASLKQFDSGAMALTARVSTVPAQAAAPISPASLQGQAAASSAPLPVPPVPASAQTPNLLATLKDIDTSSDEMAASVMAVKNADLTYSMFSRHRVTEVIARMEQQLPMLKARTADLRREESLGMLLSMRTAFSDVQRNVASVSVILHGVTVRTPAEADALDRLLAHLDGAAAHLDAALKQFDTGALAMIGALDKQAADKPTP
jgi:exonuclease VII small subunit